MEINYEEIEQATSKGFVELIKSKLGKSTMWKHFEIDDTKDFYCVDAIECHVTSPNCTFTAYHFQYGKRDKDFFDTNLSTHFIKNMIKKGWFDDSISK